MVTQDGKMAPRTPTIESSFGSTHHRSHIDMKASSQAVDDQITSSIKQYTLNTSSNENNKLSKAHQTVPTQDI